jgi:hypothetical protein
MTNQPVQRVDEISQYYQPVEKIEKINTILFWVNVLLSFLMPYALPLVGKIWTSGFQAIFFTSVLVYFVLSQASSLFFLPLAEQMRRKQMLANSFGAPISIEKTVLYYNNTYTPSIERLGANTMENALFSQAIADKMLGRRRIQTICYMLVWLIIFTIRHENLEVLTWITQLVFSAEILNGWLRLEILRFRYQEVFDDLHKYFVTQKQTPSLDNATVLDSFVAYESAKSNAGILLSSRNFNQLNPSLSRRWEEIRQQLGMK